MKIFLFAILFANVLFAKFDTNLLYQVEKDGKNLGFYEINYKSNGIKTKSYGVSSKVKFFVNKNIFYVNDGIKNISFTKNQTTTKFKAYTKLDKITNDIAKKYNRKLKKVKHNDMLLLIKNNKNAIELFNKRKIILLTIEEIIQKVL